MRPRLLAETALPGTSARGIRPIAGGGWLVHDPDTAWRLDGLLDDDPMPGQQLLF